MPLSTLAATPAPPADYAEILDRLVDAELVADLDGPELRALAAHLLLRRFAGGATVFREGEPGDWMGLLVEGEISIRKEADARVMRTVAVESRSRAIGEMALIDGEPRSATCVATRPATLLVLTRERFRRLSAARPALALEVMTRVARTLSRRLRQTSGRLIEHLEG